MSVSSIGANQPQIISQSSQVTAPKMQKDSDGDNDGSSAATTNTTAIHPTSNTLGQVTGAQVNTKA